MNRRSVTVWSVGLGSLAAAALAASRGEPVEATIPPNDVIPAAESVEPVLRATYALPPGRSQPLAQFLSAHAADGIDVRLTADDRITVVAPNDAQKALGTFIEKCIRKESTAATDLRLAPDAPPYNTYEGGSPTLAPPINPDADRRLVPDYSDPQSSDSTPPQTIRQRPTPPDDGFQPPSTRHRPGDSPFMEPDPGA